jgi:hypothetical protein
MLVRSQPDLTKSMSPPSTDPMAALIREPPLFVGSGPLSHRSIKC